MALPTVAGEFRMVADPDLRFTPSGKAVASLRLVASKRKKNDAGDWVDDKTFWINATAWDQVAENIAETLRQGMLVSLHGAIYTQSWEDKDGNKRSSPEIQLYAIGPSLSTAVATVRKVERSDKSGGQQQRPPAEDPWSTGPSSDDPPFR